MFRNLEVRNGTRDAVHEECLRQILAGLSPAVIARYAEKHPGTPVLNPEGRYGLVGGSDDHAGLSIARASTTFIGERSGRGVTAALRERRTRARRDARHGDRARAQCVRGAGWLLRALGRDRRDQTRRVAVVAERDAGALRHAPGRGAGARGEGRGRLGGGGAARAHARAHAGRVRRSGACERRDVGGQGARHRARQPARARAHRPDAGAPVAAARIGAGDDGPRSLRAVHPGAEHDAADRACRQPAGAGEERRCGDAGAAGRALARSRHPVGAALQRGAGAGGAGGGVAARSRAHRHRRRRQRRRARPAALAPGGACRGARSAPGVVGRGRPPVDRRRRHRARAGAGAPSAGRLSGDGVRAAAPAQPAQLPDREPHRSRAVLDARSGRHHGPVRGAAGRHPGRGSVPHRLAGVLHAHHR